MTKKVVFFFLKIFNYLVSLDKIWCNILNLSPSNYSSRKIIPTNFLLSGDYSILFVWYTHQWLHDILELVLGPITFVYGSHLMRNKCHTIDRKGMTWVMVGLGEGCKGGGISIPFLILTFVHIFFRILRPISFCARKKVTKVSKSVVSESLKFESQVE